MGFLYLLFHLLFGVGTSQGQGACYDEITTCPSYGPQMCVNFRTWATHNCCAYCQSALPCSDKQLNCSRYGSNICLNFATWAQENCCHYCKANAASATSATPFSTTRMTTLSQTLASKATTQCVDNFSVATCQKINACKDPSLLPYCRRFCNVCCHDDADGNCGHSNACATIVSALKCRNTCGLCHCRDKVDCGPLQMFCLKVNEITLKCPYTCGLCAISSGQDVIG